MVLLSRVKEILSDFPNLGKSTVKLYYKMAENLCNQFNTISLKVALSKPERVIEYLNAKTDNLNSRVTNAVYIDSLFKYIVQLKIPKKVRIAYADYLGQQVVNRDAEAGENAPEENLMRPNGKLLRWSNIVDSYERVPDSDIDNKLLMAFYCLMPPRRLDYRMLKFVKKKPSQVRQSTDNLIWLDDQGKYEVRINSFKTSNYYSTCAFVLPEKLGEIVTEYIRLKKIKNNKSIFKSPDGLEMTADRGTLFGKMLRSAFMKYCPGITMKPLTLNSLRHVFISSLNMNQLSFANKKLLATRMAHSVETQAKYQRVNLLENFRGDKRAMQIAYESIGKPMPDVDYTPPSMQGYAEANADDQAALPHEEVAPQQASQQASAIARASPRASAGRVASVPQASGRGSAVHEAHQRVPSAQEAQSAPRMSGGNNTQQPAQSVSRVPQTQQPSKSVSRVPQTQQPSKSVSRVPQTQEAQNNSANQRPPSGSSSWHTPVYNNPVRRSQRQSSATQKSGSPSWHTPVYNNPVRQSQL